MAAHASVSRATFTCASCRSCIQPWSQAACVWWLCAVAVSTCTARSASCLPWVSPSEACSSAATNSHSCRVSATTSSTAASLAPAAARRWSCCRAASSHLTRRCPARCTPSDSTCAVSSAGAASDSRSLGRPGEAPGGGTLLVLARHSLPALAQLKQNLVTVYRNSAKKQASNEVLQPMISVCLYTTALCQEVVRTALACLLLRVNENKFIDWVRHLTAKE